MDSLKQIIQSLIEEINDNDITHVVFTCDTSDRRAAYQIETVLSKMNIKFIKTKNNDEHMYSVPEVDLDSLIKLRNTKWRDGISFIE